MFRKHKLTMLSILLGSLIPLVVLEFRDDLDLVMIAVSSAPLLLGILGFLLETSRSRVETTSRQIKELEDLKRQLDEAQSIAKIGSWEFDLRTYEQKWSLEHYKIFEIDGPKPQELLYELYRTRIHPEDFDQLDHLLEKAKRTGDGFTFNHRVVLDSGKRIKHVQGICQVLKDKDGSPSRLVGTCRELTSQVENEARISTIFKNLTEGVIVHDEKGTITYSNEAANRILKPNGNLSLRWPDAIDKDGQPYKLDEYPGGVSLRSGHPVTGSLMGLRVKEDEVRWIRINAVPLEEQSGRHVIVTFSDITELLAIQDQLKQSYAELSQIERQLHLAMDATGEGLWDWRINEGIVHHNQQWCRLLGLQDGFLKHPVEEFTKRIHPEDVQSVWGRIEAALIKDQPYSSEHRLMTSDGSYVWVLDRGKVVERDANGKPMRMVGSCRDVQGLRNAQAQAIQASKLATLGEMSAGVAHEINNPLAIIEGSLSLIRKYGSGNDRIESCILRMEKAVLRISRIIHGLRKYSRTAEHVHMKPVAMKSIVEEVLVFTDSIAKLHSVMVQCHVSSESILNCNEIEIEQVLVNLITNAIDAVKERSERWVRVEVEETSSSLVLRVRDSGPGISKELESRIFEPFFTTKPPGSGTGLGLSITKGILDQHGASIRLDRSDPHTCFEITFPRQSEIKRAS